MKLHRNFGVYAVITVKENEKLAKTSWGKKVLQETGGLSYIWNASQILPTSKFGTPLKREYKNHQNGHGILIYKCERCGSEMNDISTRGVKKKFCSNCTKDGNRKYKNGAN